MKTWEVAVEIETPEHNNIHRLDIEADHCFLKDGCLIFTQGEDETNIKEIFAPGRWVMAMVQPEESDQPKDVPSPD